MATLHPAMTLPWHRAEGGGEEAEVELAPGTDSVMPLYWRVRQTDSGSWRLIMRVNGVPSEHSPEFEEEGALYFPLMRDAKAHADAATRHMVVNVVPAWEAESEGS